jgi:hypothetical protein
VTSHVTTNATASHLIRPHKKHIVMKAHHMIVNGALEIMIEA